MDLPSLPRSQPHIRKQAMLRRISVAALSLALLVSNGNASIPRVQNRESWSNERGLSTIGQGDRDVEVGADARASEPPGSAPTLPNGANALKETYGDWAVECRIIKAEKTCVIGQIHFDNQQRIIFSIEILSSPGGQYRAEVVLPFGLDLPGGIRLKVDDQAVEMRGAFATCLPYGCLVSIEFPDASIATMTTARTLRVSAGAFRSDQSATFNVSLSGFSAAIERLKDLK